ncbi:MAG: Flp pilus assembly protein CpaB [Planctomycetes bacterium]|nr:Flp pilus assembly protein CpaB [Planctomycetota bacterium]
MARIAINKLAIVPLVMGAAIGGLAIKLGLDTVRKAKAGGQVEEVIVVVAATNIPATTLIEARMLRELKTPASPLVGEDGFSSKEDLVDRVAATSIPRGALVREALLAPEGTPPGLSVRIPAGYRAVSVKIDEVSGVAYQLTPGCFVDVIAVMDVKEGRRRETLSRIILQKVEVAAVGQVINKSNDSGGKDAVAKSVTLLVRVAEVPKLHLAQTRGKVTLAMRSPEDDRESPSGTTKESELFGMLPGNMSNPAPRSAEASAALATSGTKRTPAPVKHRPGPFVVEVVNGLSDLQRVTYENHTSLTSTNVERYGAGRAASALKAALGKKGEDNETFDSD